MASQPKKKPTDYNLCIYCQTETTEKLVNTQYKTFKVTSYGKFLDCIEKRYEYGNPEFVSAGQRLSGITVDELKAKTAGIQVVLVKQLL